MSAPSPGPELTACSVQIQDCARTSEAAAATATMRPYPRNACLHMARLLDLTGSRTNDSPSVSPETDETPPLLRGRKHVAVATTIGSSSPGGPPRLPPA